MTMRTRQVDRVRRRTVMAAALAVAAVGRLGPVATACTDGSTDVFIIGLERAATTRSPREIPTAVPAPAPSS
ncbi:MAG: hypothetical protein ACYTGG_06480 [Planctomycetota bacterium]|jgi:hypothetical protein